MNVQRLNPDGIVSISASVTTGMEDVAATEVKSKILNTSDKHAVTAKQGRVYFKATKKSLSDLHSLRSVDRLYLVIHTEENYVYPESKEAAEEDLSKLASSIDWDSVTQFWRYNLPYLKARSRQEDLGKKPSKKRKVEESAHDVLAGDNSTDDDDESGNPMNGSHKHDDIPIDMTALPIVESKAPISFRVSTNRVGKNQPITSPEASYKFGGKIQDITNWKVDLTGYNLEILLCLGLNSLEVTLALTLQSLHRRNITHFGITTLRPTTAYNMLQLCDIQPGDVVIDPMCGTGAIPVEGALEWPNNFYIAGDIVKAATKRCRCNVEFLDENVMFGRKFIDKTNRKNLLLDTIRWDTTNLPLKSSSADVIVSDLPFGKRVGSKVDNRKLYPAILQEMARVTRPETGRACLLTQDKRTIIRALSALNQFWTVRKTLSVNIGGLTAGVFLLRRTKNSVQHPHIDEHNSAD